MKSINKQEVQNLMKTLGLTEEEAIELWKCDNDMAENEEQKELDKKASKVKIKVADGNVTKGVKKPRTYISCDEKVALFNLIKTTLESACENVEVTKDNKLLTVNFNGVQFKVDLIKTNTALAERKGKK